MLTDGNENNSNLLNKISFFDIDGRHGEKQNTGFRKIYFKISGNNLIYRYLRNSHVLGSCAFYFQWTEENYPDNYPEKEREWKYLYFSGDIGSVSDKLITNNDTKTRNSCIIITLWQEFPGTIYGS